jgi:hypothetical protein
MRTVIIDDSGRYVKVIVEAHLLAPKEKYASIDTNLAKMLRPNTDQMFIITPDMQYAEDLDSLTGVRLPPQPVFSAKGFFGPDMKIIGRETLPGKPCEIDEINDGIRVWTWKGITLRTQNIQKGNEPVIKLEAVSIDEQYLIKPDEFQIPKNARVSIQ